MHKSDKASTRSKQAFWRAPQPYLGVSVIAALTFVMVASFSTSKANGSDLTGAQDDDLVQNLHAAYDEHVSQELLTELVTKGENYEAFEMAFELGDELFEHNFSAVDGVGANVGNGQSFTNFPRADLSAQGEWAQHFPARSTGPNAQSCQSCHNQHFGSTSSGAVATNVVRDPLHTGDITSFITRNTTHTFGSGAVQRLAEEMTEDLHALRDEAVNQAKTQNVSVTLELQTKGVSFGSVTAHTDGTVDDSAFEGIDADLVVKPFQWKGSDSSLRAFVRDASHGELGMQAVEMVGQNVDGDFDGVVNELTTGDITAMVIYAAAQPRPVTQLELADLGLIEPLTPEVIEQINYGEMLFTSVGCASCHTASMTLNDPVFTEPSQSRFYRDLYTPAGQLLDDLALDIEHAVNFNLTQDQPDNRIELNGQDVQFGSFEASENGGAIINLYSDLKRHDMGAGLAEPIDEVGTGEAVFLTKELWGVGDTAPYLHDGRATTLSEAILEHGGEAEYSRNTFRALSPQGQEAMIAFLNNLKLFLQAEE